MSDTIIKPSLFFAYNNFIKSYKFLQENFSESLNDHLEKIGNSFPLLRNVGAFYHADYSEDLDTETPLYLASLTYNLCSSLIGESHSHKESIDNMDYESWNMNDFPSDYWIRKDGFIIDENLKDELTNLSSFFRDSRINIMLQQNFGSNFIIKYNFIQKELVIEDYEK